MKKKKFHKNILFNFQKISNILKSYDALDIIRNMDSNKLLDDSQRAKMCSLISNYFVSRYIWIKRKDFPVITKLIKNEFPNELEEFYYRPPNEESNSPGGMFYNKYMKVVRQAEKHELLTRVNKKNKITRNNISGTIYFKIKF